MAELSKIMASTATARAFMNQCERLGIDVDQWLAQAGLRREIIEDPDERVDSERMKKLIVSAIELTGDEYLGLHAAEHTPPGDFGVPDFIAGNATNFGDGIEKLCRYFRIVSEGCEFVYENQGEMSLVRFDILYEAPEVTRQLAEFGMGCAITRFRRSVVGGFTILKMFFSYQSPRDLSEYQRVFQCPLHFGQSINGFFIPTNETERKIQGANVRLAKIVQKVGDQILAEMNDEGTTDKVRRFLNDSYLKGEEASMDEASKRLGMSRRTLARRLSEEGHSFQNIREELQRDLACRWLGNSDMSIGQVAFLLGFSEPSAFYRAFKRWTDTTPQSYRKQSLNYSGSG